MSLSSLIRTKEYEQKFKNYIKYPKVDEGQIIVNPQTERYGLVGTTFDYLIRFYVQKNNLSLFNNVSFTWNAERGLVCIFDLKLSKKCDKHIENAKKLFNKYLNGKILLCDLIPSSILLAKLDIAYRCGIVDEYLFECDKLDVLDLESLCNVIDSTTWKADSVCLLNPSFGKGSALVGRADGDVILDNMLIEIKVTKRLKESLKRTINELIGYCILNVIDDFATTGVKIDTIGVYSARHAKMFTFKLDDIICESDLLELANWMKGYIQSAK